MKKSTRFIAFALAAAIALPLLSCGGGNDGERIDLEIENEKCEYTPMQTDAISAGVIKIVEKIYKDDAERFGEEEKKKLDSAIREQFLPICANIPIYEHEIESLLSITDEFLSSVGGLGDISRLYSRACTLLGSERCGIIAYEILLFGLSYEISRPDVDADTAAKREEQLNILRGSVEKENFPKMLASLALFANIFSGGLSVYLEEGAVMSENEMILVVREYSDYLSSLDISEESWRSLGKIISGFGISFGKGMSCATFEAMKKGALEELFGAAPELINFICASFSALDPLDIMLIRNGRRSVYSIIFQGSSLEQFLAFDSELRSKQYDPEPFKEIIKSVGLYDAFVGFCELDKDVDAKDFFEFMSTYKKNSLPRDEITGYLRSISPELAFIFQTVMLGDPSLK